MYLLESVALIFLYWVINVRKVSYRKFRHLLLDKKMKKFQFQEAAGIGRSSLYSLLTDRNVNTNVLVKVCDALNCEISDIMELVPVEDNDKS